MRQILLFLLALLAFATLCPPAAAQSVTRSTFAELGEIQELIDADQLQEALSRIEVLVTKTNKRPYDQAIAYQYLAHISVMLDQPERARSALKLALETPDLPLDIIAPMTLLYGTVLLGDEEYVLARDVLEEWLTMPVNKRAEQLFPIGYANYMAGDIPRAESLLRQAIAGHEAPPDTWYRLYYRTLFEQKKYDAAEELLHELLTRYPSVELHWRMLASHHLQLESSNEALAAIMVAYINEFVTKGSDLRQIVSLFSYIDVPEKGARLLQQWLDDESLETDADTLQQLGNLWLLARERDNAKAALQQAATLATDGRTHELLAGIYFEDEDWQAAYSSYRDALRSGDLKEPLRVKLLAGISAYRAGRNADAKRSLQAAAESDEFRSQAESILRRLDGG